MGWTESRDVGRPATGPGKEMEPLSLALVDEAAHDRVLLGAPLHARAVRLEVIKCSSARTLDVQSGATANLTAGSPTTT
jgi:hypothetical protein